jgi:DNA-binding CsgD family transcriptional regulator
MAGPAITPKLRQCPAKRNSSPSKSQAAELPARITVGSRAFFVMAEQTRKHGGGPDKINREQARFDLCGLTFVVVEEPAVATKIDDNNIAARLTERELQIAILVATGDAVKRIAFKLGITEWTVKEYLRRIFAKLHVRSQAAMVYQCADLFRRLNQEGRLPLPTSISNDVRLDA